MRATVARAEAILHLEVEHEAVTALIDALTDEEMTRSDTIQHGLYYDQECSFKDLLAHLVCYEALTLEAIAQWREGVKHWVVDAIDDPRASREIHYGGIADREELSLSEQLDEYRRVSARLEQTLGTLSDAQWRKSAPFPAAAGMDLGGMIERIMVMPPRPLYRHLPVHVPDSATYIKRLRQASRHPSVG